MNIVAKPLEIASDPTGPQVLKFPTRTVTLPKPRVLQFDEVHERDGRFRPVLEARIEAGWGLWKQVMDVQLYGPANKQLPGVARRS